MKDRMIRDITNPSEKEKDYYKPVRVGNVWNSNYIEYQRNCDKKHYHLKNT